MDKLIRILALLTLFAIVLAFTAPGLAQSAAASQAASQATMPGSSQGSKVMPVVQSDKDMVAAMQDTKEISVAAATMKAAGIESMLRPGEKYTLFVASDEALATTSPDMKDAMGAKLKDPQVAKDFVEGHLVSGMVMPAELTDGKRLTTMNGITMQVRNTGGRIMVDDASLIKAVKTSNGIVYVMDKIPSSIGAMMGEMGMMPTGMVPGSSMPVKSG